MNPEDHIKLLQRKLERERAARKESERLLEEKSTHLYETNQKLKEYSRQKDEQLQRTEERFRSIIENAVEIIYRTDDKGNLKYVNKAGLELFGYEKEEAKGIHFTSFIHPDDKEEVNHFYHDQFQSQISTTYKEFRAVSKTGRLIWIGQNVQYLWEDGHLKEIVCVARDLSEQKAVSHELEDTTLRLTNLIQNIHGAILVENEDRKIILVNKQFCDLFGIPAPPEALVGADCANSAEESKHLFKNESSFVDEINLILKNRVPVIGDQLMMKDGRVVERDYIPIFASKVYKGHLWQYRDITERKQAEKLQRLNEEKYRSIIENMELGLLEVDNNGRIIRAYDRFCQMVGYRPEELIGKYANHIFLPPEYDSVMKQQTEDRQAGKGGVYEVEMITKSGKRIWVLISGAPVIDSMGNQNGTIGIHYDITQRKELEEDLKRATDEANRSRDVEKQFLADMSHEIRNPINAIVGVTNLLYDTPLNDQQLDFVKTIKYSSDILLQLISGILDLSKIDAGKIELEEKAIDIRALAAAIVKTYEFRSGDKAIKFTLDIRDDVPMYVWVDMGILNQILLNLLGNATKFTEQGEIGLRIESIDKEDKNHTMQFTVWDTGLGIDSNKVQMIFESFKQASSDIKLKYGGTGLGLSIVKNLIQYYDGTITVDSTPDKGSAFIFQLKLKEVEKQAESGEEVSSVSLRGSDFNEVLIVEDNKVNQKYLAALLSKWDVKFQVCNDGAEALERSKMTRFDIILMDIRMPVMDGYEATIQIRSDKNNPNSDTPIVALTASALVDEKEKALSSGMNYHITKPFTETQLLHVMKIFKSSIKDTLKETAMNTFSFSTDLDHTYLNDFYADDYDRAALMFSLFIKNVPEDIESLKKLIENSDWEALGKLTHKIKPNFKMVGLSDAFEILEEVENTIKSGNTLEVEHIKSLKGLIDSLPGTIEIVEKESERLEMAIMNG